MLKPMGPYIFRSIITAWKTQRPKRMPLVFWSASSICSLEKKQKARFRLAFKPPGGSLVSLMDRASRPMGMAFDGSDVKKRRKRSWLSIPKSSSFFSSSTSQRGMRWMLFKMTQ